MGEGETGRVRARCAAAGGEMAGEGSIVIAMATRNGVAHLPAQLASLAAQSRRGWRLIASDDGSQDRTRALLRAFMARRAEGSGAAALMEKGRGGEQAPPGPDATFPRHVPFRGPRLSVATAHLFHQSLPPDSGSSRQAAGRWGAGQGVEARRAEGASSSPPPLRSAGRAPPSCKWARSPPDGSRLSATDRMEPDSPPCAVATASLPPALRSGAGDRLLQGPRQGYGANFLHALAHAPADCRLLAFCDQDDIWHPVKLAAAEAALARIRGPAIWCSAREAFWPDGRRRYLPPPRRPRFGTALWRNPVPGNSMVLNRAALRLLRRALTCGRDHAPPIPAHDWFAALIVLGAGGWVLTDPYPFVAYRQHDGNLFGAPVGLRGWTHRLGLVLDGRQGRRIRANLAWLLRALPLLTPANRRLVQRLAPLAAPHPSRAPAAIRRPECIGALLRPP